MAPTKPVTLIRPAARPPVRTAFQHRAPAQELFERALRAHDRARNCLFRAHSLITRAHLVLEEVT
jgi:hypothetical protein